jgi:hypothetical protein
VIAQKKRDFHRTTQDRVRVWTPTAQDATKSPDGRVNDHEASSRLLHGQLTLSHVEGEATPATRGPRS